MFPFQGCMTIAIDKPESAGFRIKTAENLAKKKLTGLLITISGGFSQDCGLKVRPQSGSATFRKTAHVWGVALCSHATRMECRLDSG